MIGKTFTNYTILKKLGEGGMGVVYLARDNKLERQVALKFLPAHIVDNEVKRKRFEIEAKAAAALNHPNITTIYSIDEAGDDIFIVMEYIEGEELKDKIQYQDWNFRKAISIAIKVGKGLQAAHEKGIIHRDIKSSNIMVTAQDAVKIMDFGLAKLHGVSELTRQGETLGTVAYMSPEQIRGDETDQRADIWSFGVVLYEMLTGELPFQGQYEHAIMYAIMNEEPRPIRDFTPDVPAELANLVGKMLEKDRTQRYQSSGDIVGELEHVQNSEATTASSQTPKKHQPEKRPDDRKSSRVFFIPVILLAIAITVLLVLKPFAGDSLSEPMTMAPFTSLPGLELHPDFSPDGQEIAFSWNGGEGLYFDIYVQIIGTLEPQKLTNTAGSHSHPVWTPDGRSIMYARFTPYSEQSLSGTLQFVQIPARGGTEKILLTTENITPSASPNPYDISPSGSEYVSLMWDGAFKLATYDAQNYSEIPLDTITNPPEAILGDAYPIFSPDGNSLAFMRSAYDLIYGDIYIMDYPVGETRFVTRINGEFGGYSWLPDGKEIVYAADNQLYRIPIENGTPQSLAITSGLQASQPDVAPRGDRMAFVQSTIQWADLYQMDISDVNNREATPQKILSSSLDERFAKISPDGNRVVFVSNRTGTTQIWVSNLDGSSATPIADLPGQAVSHPVWSPDGSMIAFDGDGIQVISSYGGNARKLITEGAVYPRFASDGRWVYYTSTRDADNQIWKISISGGEPVQVTYNGAELVYESTDGKWLYYSRYWFPETGIYKKPVNGGEEVQVIDIPVFQRAWLLVDSGIYYCTFSFGKYEMFYYDFISGQTTKIREDIYDDELDGYFDVSPDGNTLIFASKNRPESDIMLIENFR